MYAIKDKALILEGDRNYFDGLRDIPIYKTSISNTDYHAPNIHPGIYPSNRPAAMNSLIANKMRKPLRKRESQLRK